jgi:drug/metabolite transporter (DMT)-like permease
MKMFFAFAAMTTFTVIANLLMKIGAVSAMTRGDEWWHLINYHVVAGLSSFGIAAAIYVFILQRLPLNIAQSFMAAQFVAVILASTLVLSEPIGATRWAGITLIAAGIAVVGWSQ